MVEVVDNAQDPCQHHRDGSFSVGERCLVGDGVNYGHVTFYCQDAQVERGDGETDPQHVRRQPNTTQEVASYASDVMLFLGQCQHKENEAGTEVNKTLVDDEDVGQLLPQGRKVKYDDNDKGVAHYPEGARNKIHVLHHTLRLQDVSFQRCGSTHFRCGQISHFWEAGTSVVKANGFFHSSSVSGDPAINWISCRQIIVFVVYFQPSFRCPQERPKSIYFLQQPQVRSD